MEYSLEDPEIPLKDPPEDPLDVEFTEPITAKYSSRTIYVRQCVPHQFKVKLCYLLNVYRAYRTRFVDSELENSISYPRSSFRLTHKRHNFSNDIRPCIVDTRQLHREIDLRLAAAQKTKLINNYEEV